jgi:hypothetical protein
MSQEKTSEGTDSGALVLRWRDLYRVGFVACIAIVVTTAAAVVVYFIWPYAPGSTDVASIFSSLQSNRLAGLATLDVSTIIIGPFLIPQIIAMCMALRRVNESYALIALVFGLMGTLLLFTARPLAEMSYLSNQYSAATSDAMRSQYIAAGEALDTLFNGTAWSMYNIFVGISFLISSIMMIRSGIFTKITAYVGIVISVIGFGFLVPVIGAILLLLGTLGGEIWYLLMARTFFRLGWNKSTDTNRVQEQADYPKEA